MSRFVAVLPLKLSDKQAGPFKLEVACVKVLGASSVPAEFPTESKTRLRV